MSALTARTNPHVHSEGSYDTHDPMELIPKQATEVGLDTVVVADHDIIDESFRAAQLVPMYGLVGIPGMEVSTTDGYLLAPGVEELPLRCRPLDETVRWVREHGDAAIVPHPFQRNRCSIGHRRLGRYHDAAGGDAFDAIETYNLWLFTGYKNRRARRFAARRQYPGAAGSDTHRVGYVGRAYTGIDIPDVSRASLMANSILTAVRSDSAEVQSRRTPIPMNTRHYVGMVSRKFTYYIKRGTLGGALLAKKGVSKSDCYAKLGALKSGSLAKMGVAQAARMFYWLSPLSQ